MRCEQCGLHGETKGVTLLYNIGAIILRWQGRTGGQLCKSCISRTYWKYTGINMTLGWWGLISFFATFGFMISNTVQYIGSLRMQPPDPNYVPPVQQSVTPSTHFPEQLTHISVQQLAPYHQQLIQRYQSGVPADQVAREYAATTNCAESQIRLYIEETMKQHAAASPAPAPAS